MEFNGKCKHESVYACATYCFISPLMVLQTIAFVEEWRDNYYKSQDECKTYNTTGYNL